MTMRYSWILFQSIRFLICLRSGRLNARENRSLVLKTLNKERPFRKQTFLILTGLLSLCFDEEPPDFLNDVPLSQAAAIPEPSSLDQMLASARAACRIWPTRSKTPQMRASPQGFLFPWLPEELLFRNWSPEGVLKGPLFGYFGGLGFLHSWIRAGLLTGAVLVFWSDLANLTAFSLPTIFEQSPGPEHLHSGRRSAIRRALTLYVSPWTLGRQS